MFNGNVKSIKVDWNCFIFSPNHARLSFRQWKLWNVILLRLWKARERKSRRLKRFSSEDKSIRAESWEWVIKHFHASKKCRFFFKKAKKGFMFVQARNRTIHMRSRKNIKKEICDKRKKKNFNFQFYFIPTETSGTPWTCLSPPHCSGVLQPRGWCQEIILTLHSHSLSLSAGLAAQVDEALREWGYYNI